MESLANEGGESPLDPRLLADYPSATETLQ
jgi:hypothetical protein